MGPRARGTCGEVCTSPSCNLPFRGASTTREQMQSLERDSLNGKLALKIIQLDFHPQSLTHPKGGTCLSLDDCSSHLATLSKAGDRGYLLEAWGSPTFVLITLKYFIPPPFWGYRENERHVGLALFSQGLPQTPRQRPPVTFTQKQGIKSSDCSVRS